MTRQRRAEEDASRSTAIAYLKNISNLSTEDESAVQEDYCSDPRSSLLTPLPCSK